MPSRLFVRSILILSAILGVSAVGASAQAGIIVTVGKPCPEVTLQRKPTPEGQRASMFEAETSDTRCVVMPDGQTKCAKTIRVETVSALPADWRCIQVAKAVLYCETPSFGSSPGAAGEGEFDPDMEMEDEDFVADEELQTLGCSGGAGFEGIAMGLGGLLLLVAARRSARIREGAGGKS